MTEEKRPLDIEWLIDKSLKEDISPELANALRKAKATIKKLASEHYDMCLEAQNRFHLHLIQELSPEAGKAMLLLKHSFRQSTTVDDLAELTGWSKKKASRCLKELVEGDILVVDNDSPDVFNWSYYFGGTDVSPDRLIR